MKRLGSGVGLAVALLFGGLTSSCTDFEGEYDSPLSDEIVDDKWNEYDARKTSEVLISSMLKRPWLAQHKGSHSGKRPIVLVGGMENRTDEHIDTQALTEAVRNELINSGRIRFVDKKGRSKILAEMEYQNKSGHVDASKAQKLGRQIGAQFMLTGALSSQVHRQGELKTVTYQTLLQLTNLETAEIVWTEKHDIRKRFRRSSTTW